MSEIFAARLTAEVPSAIATIAVAGPQVLSAVLQYVRIAHKAPVVGQIYYGLWQLGGEGASEQVVFCRIADNAVEIHCHGGLAICRGILNDLKNAGCTVVPAKDWNMSRASINEQPSSIEPLSPIAEAAAQDLLLSTTDRAAAILLDQFNGALQTKLHQIMDMLSAADGQQAERELDGLIRWGVLGERLANPWRVVLAGPPNVGKSSLINAIVGSQQSIVHHEPGTTRDWVEASCAIAGWPVCLSDTAGLRASDDSIELAGIDRARQQITQADLVLVVVDATVGWTSIHHDLCQTSQARGVPVVVVWNKADVGPCKPLPGDFEVVETSAVEYLGIDRLLNLIAGKLVPESPDVGVAVPFRKTHADGIRAARDAVGAGELKKAIVFLESLLLRLG